MSTDPLAELAAAQQKAMEALPTWAKDGSAEKPSGPPQIPLPPPRAAKLEIQTPAAIAGGNSGAGGDELPTITVALALKRAAGVFEAVVCNISGVETEEEP